MDESLERERKIRGFQKNPPKVEVGMSDPWAEWKRQNKENEEKLAQEAVNTNTSVNQGMFGVGNNDKPNVELGSFTPQVNQPSQSGGGEAEKYVIAVLKEIGETVKGVIKSFKGKDIEFASRYGRALMFVGLGVFVFSMFFTFLGMFVNVKMPLTLGGGGSLLVSAGLFVMAMISNKTSPAVEEEEEVNEEVDIEDVASFLLSDDNSNGEQEEVEEATESVDPVSMFNNFRPNPTPKRLSIEEATKGLDTINPEMYTRSFLYERFEAFLPRKTPDFNKMKTLSENSEEFLRLDILLREACRFVGIKEENLPIIDKLEENAFVLQLSCKRRGLSRVKDIANEIANAYKYDENGVTIHEGAYATYKEFGNTVIITLFKGTSAMITLGDIFPKVKDFILDTKNMIPIVLGVDELGQPIFTDFKKVDSVIISGLPRTGKSLTMQSIVAQLCMFMSPKEVQFHIMDLKDGISDFQGIETGHIKSFSNTTSKCINTIRYIVKEVGAERKKFLQSYGFKNILDFKKKHPDVEFPFIYLVVDEMMNLAEEMDKDEKAEFQGLLTSLISMMPALGVRVILIPHRIVNDVISKNSYSLVPCRINVMGSGEDLEKAIGVSASAFPYKLTREGNSAVVLKGFRNGTPFFCHGALLTAETESEDIKDLFKLIDRIWGKVKIEKSEDKSFEEEVSSQETLDLWD